MLCTKSKCAAFASYLFVLGLFLFISNPGPGKAQWDFQPPVEKDDASAIDQPRHEEAWQVDFRNAYGLKEGEILKRVKEPFPPSRSDYFHSIKAGNNGMKPDEMALSYRWDGKNVSLLNMVFPGNKPTGSTLANILIDIGIPFQEIEGDKELLGQHIPGEFVLRTGVPSEKVIPRLEQILREELHLPIQLALASGDRDVMVVGGKYEPKPTANRQPNKVDLFAVAPRQDSDAGGGSGTFDKFLEATGNYIGRRLINDVADPPKNRILWYYHNSTQVLPGPDPNQEAEGVLKNVTAQTGLTFKPERRTVRVLQVKKNKP